MTKPGTTKAIRERKTQMQRKRAGKRFRNLTSPPKPAPMPTNKLPTGRTTASGGGRIKYNKGGEAMPKAKPC